MAAPSVTTRVVPTGLRLDDGFGSVIAFSTDANLEVWETSVTPAASDGGDPIVTTTHLNASYVTKAAQELIEHDDMILEGAYDPGKRSTFDGHVNLEQSFTQAWPEGSYGAFWGYARRFEFSPLVKGERPLVTITIVITNWDPNLCVEAGPVWHDGTGSC